MAEQAANTASTTSTRQLSGDRPKEKIAEDRLGYASFAKALALSIYSMAPTDGLVLAIHGPWGSGKTSAVNMTVDALTELQADHDEIAVVRFNPWWFSEQENLTRAFFSEVSAALSEQVSSKVIDGLKGVARRVSGAREIIAEVVGLAPGGAVIKGITTAGLKALGELASEDKGLNKLRDELRDALSEESKRILLIIDDIDRLPADEARQIFRLVKSVADLPNVIYLLVFDREIARRALDAPGNATGPEWLEKIVQASFDLPPVHPVDLNRLFTGQLEEIVGDDAPIDPSRWPKVFHYAVAPWLRTARDSARLANAIAVSWPVVKGETDLADFVALETLRLFEPNVYELVRRNPTVLCSLGDRRDVDAKAFAEQILDAAAEPRRGDVKAALQELFPTLQGVWGHHHYSGTSLNEWDKAKRVASVRRFPAYFMFAIGDDVFGQAELANLLDALLEAGALAPIVDQYVQTVRRSGGTKAALALEEIQRNVDKLPTASVAAATGNFLGAADHFLNPIDDKGFFTTPLIWRVWYAARALLDRVPRGERFSVLAKPISSSASLRIATFLVSSFASEQGVGGERQRRPEEEWLFDLPAVIKLNRLLLRRLRAAAKAGTLLEETDLFSVLFQWDNIEADGAVQRYLRRQIKTDRGALRLAQEAIGVVKVESGGIVSEKPTVQRQVIGKLLDVDKLLARLDQLRKSHADDEGAMAIINRFHEGLGNER